MFLGWRELRRAKGRFALVGVVMALTALLSTLLSGLADGLVEDGISGLRRLPLTHLAFQPGAHGNFSRSSLDEAALAAWSGRPGIEASPMGLAFFNARTDSGKTIDVALIGVPADSFEVPDARGREALAGRPGIVLSEELATSGVAVGDTLTMVGPDERLSVLGFSYRGSYGHVPVAFASLATWQHLVYGDAARGRFSAVALRVDPDVAGTAALAEADGAAGTELSTREQAYAGSPGFSAETATMSLIRVFLLVISSLVVGAFFTVWTIQRARQIGLLKALGATSAYVVRDALSQLAVVLVTATTLGVATALLLGRGVGDEVPFDLRPGPALSAGLLLIGLGLAGSLVALRRITTVDPAIALAAEP